VKRKYVFVAVAALMAGLAITGCATASPGSANASSAAAVEMVLEDEYPGMTAAAWVNSVTIGWNLGNTFDARFRDSKYARENMPDRSSAPGFAPVTIPIDQLDTWFYNPRAIKAWIDFVKEQGFNAIRIPVTWDKCADPGNNYTIRPDWMARIKEVVDWALACDMYTIINTHHDEYSYVTDAYGYAEYDQQIRGLFGFRDAEMAKSTAAFKRIWEQIAEAFADYDYKLIFEALNEPRVKSSNEWGGGIPRERRNLNAYYPIFVDAVRASGGNNQYRVLLVNPYAASRLPAALDDLAIPEDTVPNRIVVSVHTYIPAPFAVLEGSPVITWSRNNPDDTKPITEPLDYIHEKFIRKGIPVVIGELGVTEKNPAIADESAKAAWNAARAEWAEYIVRYATGKGMKCFYWDDGGNFGILSRNDTGMDVRHQHIIDALMRGIK